MTCSYRGPRKRGSEFGGVHPCTAPNLAPCRALCALHIKARALCVRGKSSPHIYLIYFIFPELIETFLLLYLQNIWKSGEKVGGRIPTLPIPVPGWPFMERQSEGTR